MKQDTLIYQIYPLLTVPVAYHLKWLTDEAVAEPTAIDGKPPNMHLDPIYTHLGYKKQHHKIQINACNMFPEISSTRINSHFWKLLLNNLFWGWLCHGPVKTFGTEALWRRRCIVNLPSNNDVADTSRNFPGAETQPLSPWGSGQWIGMKNDECTYPCQLGDLDPSNSGTCWQKQTAVGVDIPIFHEALCVTTIQAAMCPASCN